MLLGEHDHAIDDKNRLTLPAKFRQAFGDGIVVSRGMDGCLYAYPRAEWVSAIQARLDQLDQLGRETRQLRRFFYAGAIEGELDKQGRIGIPAALMEHAKLGRDVVVAGVYDHLEIWNRAAWQEQMREVEGSAEHVAERLASQRD